MVVPHPLLSTAELSPWSPASTIPFHRRLPTGSGWATGARHPLYVAGSTGGGAAGGGAAAVGAASFLPLSFSATVWTT